MYPSRLETWSESVFKEVQERRVTAEHEVEARFAINNSILGTFFLLHPLLFKNSGQNEIWRAGGQWNRKVRRFELPCLPLLLTAWFTGPAPPPSSALPLSKRAHVYDARVCRKFTICVWKLFGCRLMVPNFVRASFETHLFGLFH